MMEDSMTTLERTLQISNERTASLETILPHLKHHGLVDNDCISSSIRENELKELAVRWNVKLTDRKTKKALKMDQVISNLAAVAVNMTGPYGDQLGSKYYEDQSQHKVIPKIKAKFAKNYFGLPPYSFESNPNSILYQCRGPVKVLIDDDEDISKGNQVEESERAR